MQNLPQLAAELPHALNYSGGCNRWDRWVHRPPLRLAGELHYGNRLAGLEGSLMRFLGPGSAARQALLRCACKVVLVTRVRQPSTWYRSFWSWSGVRDRQLQNSSLYGDTLVEFARGYANLQSMLMLGNVNLGLQAQFIGIHNPKVNLSEYSCFHPSGYAPQSRRVRSSVPPPGLVAALERCGPNLADRVEYLRGTLRKFDVVGLVERFEETLLLIADLVGLQHLLRPSANVASSTSMTSSANIKLLGCAYSLDCDAQIAAASPVDELIYAEVSASFTARVEAQGEEFARRVQRLKEERALAEQRPMAPLRIHKKIKEEASKLNLTLTRRMCRGLLAGEGPAAERLCRHVIADTQFFLADTQKQNPYWRRPAGLGVADEPEWADDDLQGPTEMH